MPPFPSQGAGYLTLLSRHSLGNGTILMLPLLSLRWRTNVSLDITHLWKGNKCVKMILKKYPFHT
ncbi:MAG: hypothetical protein WBI82_11560 [Sphaerochaeta sp.]